MVSELHTEHPLWVVSQGTDEEKSGLTEPSFFKVKGIRHFNEPQLKSGNSSSPRMLKLMFYPPSDRRKEVVADLFWIQMRKLKLPGQWRQESECQRVFSKNFIWYLSILGQRAICDGCCGARFLVICVLRNVSGDFELWRSSGRAQTARGNRDMLWLLWAKPLFPDAFHWALRGIQTETF